MTARGAGLVLATLVGCAGAPPPPAKEPAPAAAPAEVAVAGACLVDQLPDPMPEQRMPANCEGKEAQCRAACESGSGMMCVSLAYVLELEPATADQATQLHRRGCELGDLNGCTNYGAALLNGLAGLTADPACAARLHRRACAGDEAWGCGMIGWELIVGAGIDADPALGRALLVETCERLGSFPCHVLGKQVEAGTFGAPDLAEAARLYRRACDTHDPTACEDAARLEAPPLR